VDGITSSKIMSIALSPIKTRSVASSRFKLVCTFFTAAGKSFPPKIQAMDTAIHVPVNKRIARTVQKRTQLINEDGIPAMT
jgi:hypothetical protein